jgi:RNA polymerase sigma-70 factor (ECF subfamily)
VEREQFERMVRESWPLITAIARRFDPGPEVADICQEVVLIAWRKRDDLRDPEAFGPWVRAIALNVGRSHTRRRQTRLGPAEYEEATAPDHADSVVDGQALEEALSQLSKRERLTVEAHHTIGWPLADIAAAFEEPLGTTKSRLSRARGKLRRELHRLGWTRLGRSEEQEDER